MSEGDWKGIEEGDIVEVVRGLGSVDELPRAEVVSLGHAADNGLPSVIVRYTSCAWVHDGDCPFCGGIKGELCRHQEWYPHQLRVVDGHES